jgi:hypothetical protein
LYVAQQNRRFLANQQSKLESVFAPSSVRSIWRRESPDISVDVFFWSDAGHSTASILMVHLGEFSHLQQGPSLIRLQQKYRFTKVLFLDECSMLHKKQLYFMDQRLRQIKANDSPFGGIAIVLIGDTGQLPAVKGRVLWDNKPSTSENDILERISTIYLQRLSIWRKMYGLTQMMTKLCIMTNS